MTNAEYAAYIAARTFDCRECGTVTAGQSNPVDGVCDPCYDSQSLFLIHSH